jgi:hypothetical protein
MYPPPLLIETTIQGTGCVNCARPDLWGVSSSQAIDWTALSRKLSLIKDSSAPVLGIDQFSLLHSKGLNENPSVILCLACPHLDDFS